MTSPSTRALTPQAPLRPLAIGLTGGIGSGKSTAATRLVDLGAALVDTDAIAHRISAPGGRAIGALRAAFGDAAIAANGAMDRAHMRQLVFNDSAAKARLEAILHPMIGEDTRAQSEAAAAAGCPAIVFDVPLLTESRAWRSRCDRILVVDCDEATQVQRVMARSGWPEEQVRSVIAQQASRRARRAIADAVVFNDGISPAQVGELLGALWRDWGLPGHG